MAGKALTTNAKSRTAVKRSQAANGRLDEAAIRRDFPLLDQEVNGHKLVYLDNAATSQKPQSVIDALNEYYREYNSNVHRGIHALSQEATERFEQARAKVARFIGAESVREIIFTKNATESINLVAYAWARKNLKAGDEVLTTEFEHHSNIVPWQLAALHTGATFKYLPLHDHATPPDLGELARLITDRTKLVAITHMSNVLGTITPIKEIAALAHRKGALLLVDGAQSVPHMPVDVQALGCDFLAFSGHKLLGPTGIGVLYGREELLKAMDPFLGGGDMISTVRMEGSTWNDLPYKFEAGTPNIADAIGLGAAVDYLSALGMDRVREHEIGLTAYALAKLGAVAGVTIYGPDDAAAKGGVVSFNVKDLHAHDVGQVLDSVGIAIRAGHHCAQPLMRCLGVGSTARASFYVYNTKEEIDALVAGVAKAQKFFS